MPSRASGGARRRFLVAVGERVAKRHNRAGRQRRQHVDPYDERPGGRALSERATVDVFGVVAGVLRRQVGSVARGEVLCGLADVARHIDAHRQRLKRLEREPDRVADHILARCDGDALIAAIGLPGTQVAARFLTIKRNSRHVRQPSIPCVAWSDTSVVTFCTLNTSRQLG
jgi:hypothetical protein